MGVTSARLAFLGCAGLPSLARSEIRDLCVRLRSRFSFQETPQDYCCVCCVFAFVSLGVVVGGTPVKVWVIGCFFYRVLGAPVSLSVRGSCGILSLFIKDKSVAGG